MRFLRGGSCSGRSPWSSESLVADCSRRFQQGRDLDPAYKRSMTGRCRSFQHSAIERLQLSFDKFSRSTLNDTSNPIVIYVIRTRHRDGLHTLSLGSACPEYG